MSYIEDCKCVGCRTIRADRAATAAVGGSVAGNTAMDKLGDHLDRAAGVWRTAKEETLDAANKVAELEADCAAYRAQRDDAQRAGKEVARQLDEYRADAQARASLVRQLEQEAAADTRSARAARNQLATAEAKFAAAESKLFQVNGGQLDDMRKDLFAKIEIVRTQRATIGELERENIRLERRVNDIRTERDNLRDGCTKIIGQREKALGDLAAAKRERDELATRVADLAKGLAAPVQPGDSLELNERVRGILVTRNSDGIATILFRDATQYLSTPSADALLLDARWPR